MVKEGKILCIISENTEDIPTGEHKATLIDFHPFEPSAYCWDAGWEAEINGREVYISESGLVYAGSKCDVQVGHAPSLEE